MKQNANETESNWRFRKNVKTCLQNKKSYLIPPLLLRHGHNHPISILPVKMVELPQQRSLVLNPTITNSCKELILNVAEFLDPSLKRRHARKLVWFRVKTSLCYYFEMLPPLSKVIVFF